MWHKEEISWAPYFFISPDERWIFYTQKTGSGDNYGEVFLREKTGSCSYKLMDQPEPSPSFSDAAFDFLGKKESLKLTLYHNGAEFVSWGKDGECLEISLNGTDCYEDYYIRDWRVHYNLITRRFFLTPDQKAHNRKAIILKHHHSKP